MDLEYSDEYKAFRASVREFLTGWPLQGEEAKRPVAEQGIGFPWRGAGGHCGYAQPAPA